MKRPLLLTAGTRIEATGAPFVRDAVEEQAALLADLARQFEDLLDHVWRCEREWMLDDRISFACRTHGR